jgi:putative transposase
VSHTRDTLSVSERRACAVVGISRASYRYKSKRPNKDKAVLADIRAIKTKYPTWGYKKVHRRFVTMGWRVNRKRVARIWRDHGLKAERRRPRRKAPGDTSNSCHIRKAELVNQV